MLISSSTGGAVGHHSRDAAVVLVAHHHRGHRLRDVEGAVVERANLSVLAAAVVDASRRAGRHQELIELLGHLVRGHDIRIGPCLRSAAADRHRRDGLTGSYCARTSLSSRRL